MRDSGEGSADDEDFVCYDDKGKEVGRLEDSECKDRETLAAFVSA